MKISPAIIFLGALLAWQGGVFAQPVLTINGANADYETAHVFVDEVAGVTVPLTVVFQPNAANLTKVEIFSNLNNRDRAALDANGDGIPDGILPPNGNLVVAGFDTNYYTAYSMTNMGSGVYQITLTAAKTGSYRLTARYQVQGNTNWIWYDSFTDAGGQSYRDFAIVVSPVKAQQMALYEMNVMNVNAQGTNQGQQSTFVDLYNGPGAFASNSASSRVNLNYLTNLGVNWVWVQPIHPIGIDGRVTNPDNGQPWNVGSPYSVKNFWQINPLMSKANARAAGLVEFTNFVAAADAAGLNVMLDGPFNDTSHDCELGAWGVTFFAPSANETNEIRDFEARVYSQSNDYCARASSAATIAPAPDRDDFGKWTDINDIFFGNYAALVCENPANDNNYTNEGDWFNFSDPLFDKITQNVWQYFANYILYWLDETGCPANTPPNQTYKGIDGVRADFAQGLPPQCWEYIMNVTKSRKWDFVFMAESLDGGAVSYRSNRHFDVVNENILFDLQSAAQTTDYINLFEARRSAYGFGMILLNNLSHDEVSLSDPFQSLIRYAACGTIDGCPMIFYGQEMGISTSFGFSVYEIDGGKNIPAFETFNSLQPVLNPANRNFGLDQLYPVYQGINRARQASPALRNSNRYFLSQNTGGMQESIYAVAKYTVNGGPPNLNDVVFAFVNLDRNDTQTGVFNVNITNLTAYGSNLFGILPSRLYNVRNIAAYAGADANRPNEYSWGSGVSGSTVLNNGIYVSLNPVPTSNAAWTNAPFEAQYLKLYDVTPPPVPAAPFPAKPYPYAIGTSATFSWTPLSDPVGGISGYVLLVGTSPGASNTFAGNVGNVTSYAVTGALGQTLYATVEAVSAADVVGSAGPNSAGVILLDPNGDYDGDGMSNLDEDLAGTSPLDPNSVFKIVSIIPAGRTLAWTSVVGKNYQVIESGALGGVFTNVGGIVPASTNSFTSVNLPADGTPKFYRIEVVQP